VTTDEAEEGQGLKDLDEYWSRPEVQRGMSELAQAEQISHYAQGQALFHDEGKFREAIEEYRKDTELEITTFALAYVVERAYCHMGDAYYFLEEIDNAAEAYEQALKVWRAYGYGQMPLASLAAVYLQQGRVDDAIRICEECQENEDDYCLRYVLEEARRLKAGGEPPPEPVKGCRRIVLPIEVEGPPEVAVVH